MKLSAADHQRIDSFLRQLGCNERDGDLYVQCLGAGPQSVQEIARRLKAKRTTAHSAIDRLIEHGLLFETRRGKRRLIDAVRPKDLYRLLSKKQEELELTKANLSYVEKALLQLLPDDRAKPAVKFYEGVDGLKLMLEETLEAKGEVLVFTYVDLFAGLLSEDYLENYYKRRAKKGIKTRLIFPAEEFGERINKRASEWKMQIRFLPKGLEWKSGIFAWNNTVAIQSFTEGKVTCTVIENPDIAHFYKTIIYELCWKLAAPIQP